MAGLYRIDKKKPKDQKKKTGGLVRLDKPGKRTPTTRPKPGPGKGPKPKPVRGR